MADLIFLPEAEADYQEAISWYMNRSVPAAEGFVKAVEQGLQKITDYPELWTPLDHRHRCFILKRYPYHLVYRVEGKVTLIVAVAHGRKRQGFWRNR
jgi:plasmid stabilization system protein ParE